MIARGEYPQGLGEPVIDKVPYLVDGQGYTDSMVSQAGNSKRFFLFSKSLEPSWQALPKEGDRVQRPNEKQSDLDSPKGPR